MESHKTAGIRLAIKSGLLAIGSQGKFQISTTHL